jgi:hypothetical protein
LSSASHKKCSESSACIVSRDGAGAADPSELVAMITAERAPVLITELTIEQPPLERTRRPITAACVKLNLACMLKN